MHARSRGAYGDEVLPKTKTLADYICAVLSREHSVSRMFEDLINTLADVLDPREVFPRVSQNVAAVLPHDRLALAFDEDEGCLNFQAATSDDAIPLEQRRLKVSDLNEAVAAGFKLIGDLASEYLPVVEPADFQGTAFAQVQCPAGPPAYELLRLDEDYRYLSNPACGNDYWDRFKYVQLGPNTDTFLTLGGEIRERYEGYKNASWVQGHRTGMVIFFSAFRSTAMFTRRRGFACS